MKKYKIYKNGVYMGSYKNRWEAEEAIRQDQHNDRMQSINELTFAPCNIYDIRR